MKLNIFPWIAAAFILTACTQDAAEPETRYDAPTEVQADMPEGYNAALAAELGADAYGMRSYIFATLLTGPNDAAITDEARRAELFAGHFSNMGRMAEDGKLVLAGPFGEAGDKRGLFILNVETIAEAQALVQSDPSIAAGIFKVEFAKFYASAALMQVNDIHATIQQKKI